MTNPAALRGLTRHIHHSVPSRVARFKLRRPLRRLRRAIELAGHLPGPRPDLGPRHVDHLHTQVRDLVEQIVQIMQQHAPEHDARRFVLSTLDELRVWADREIGHAVLRIAEQTARAGMDEPTARWLLEQYFERPAVVDAAAELAVDRLLPATDDPVRMADLVTVAHGNRFPSKGLRLRADDGQPRCRMLLALCRHPGPVSGYHDVPGVARRLVAMSEAELRTLQVMAPDWTGGVDALLDTVDLLADGQLTSVV